MLRDKYAEQLLALEKLFKRHYRPLRAYAFRFVNDKDTAEDIVQDVFYEFWLHKDTIRFEQVMAVRSYLFKSVYNRSINMLHSRSSFAKYTLDGTNEDLILENYLNSHMQNQEQSFLLKELKDEIEKYIETLPAQRKKIFILSRTYQLKNKEIAIQLNISIKAVEKQITKTLVDLKIFLKKKELLAIFVCLSLFFDKM